MALDSWEYRSVVDFQDEPGKEVFHVQMTAMIKFSQRLFVSGTPTRQTHSSLWDLHLLRRYLMLSHP